MEPTLNEEMRSRRYNHRVGSSRTWQLVFPTSAAIISRLYLLALLKEAVYRANHHTIILSMHMVWGILRRSTLQLALISDRIRAGIGIPRAFGRFGRFGSAVQVCIIHLLAHLVMFVGSNRLLDDAKVQVWQYTCA